MSEVPFYNRPVTFEEYKETLESTYHGYYEHAKNDPTMSEDEVIATTAQMSENYLDALDEFQANMEAENIDSENIDSEDIDGEDIDDGMDP